ncbi:MAG: efflux RND transporter periplasmic adaptor subunit [Desulfarculaceae bacterium]|nr:efflux RND transporter periplasmic adaptor subunit [Desulfarculaceae bacterium]MCF8074292.1 efflux RND transporter periplasmic adaptor subunit [Desulfarculaceae bacterium]MCF8103360.1 efflux RND transporter periplasmic adaptor subunit [Desulfarculaceae bacterium]MCF8117850.1 efflux RND transporter periplasmic adaptor subunit [Desulfarculaceae bacterium]
MLRYAAPLVCALALCLASPAAAKGPQKDPAQMPTVTVLKVPEEEVNPAAEFVGRVEAIQAVDLKVRVEGYISKVAFNEGAAVKKGELLFLIDQAPYRAQVNEAKAKVALAQATLDKAQRYIKRLKSVRAGGVAATDMDNALAAQQTARAQLQEARASLEQAEINLGYTTITAPISGRIGRAAFTVGNLVGPNSGALARLVQLNPIRVVWSISENEFVTAKLKALENPGPAQGQLVPRLKLPNGRMYGPTGKLDFTDPQVDPGTGTIAVRAVFANTDGVLLPGQYVTVLISHQQPRLMPVVPQSAVLEDREGLYVLVVDRGNRVRARRIARGPEVGTGWAVESGLQPGETIIVHGLQKARPGQEVRTVTSDQ